MIIFLYDFDYYNYQKSACQNENSDSVLPKKEMLSIYQHTYDHIFSG